MRKKKNDDPSNAPTPAMFVGEDERADEYIPRFPAQVSGAGERPSLTPPRDIRTQLKDFFSLPPDDAPEEVPPARPVKDPDESHGLHANPVGCLAMLVVAIVGGIAEDMLPLSGRQKILGMGGLVVAALLVSVWVSLNDSDLAYSDRDSHGRLARIRNRLRQLFNIPVI
jgi:hypothetical protein